VNLERRFYLGPGPFKNFAYRQSLKMGRRWVGRNATGKTGAICLYYIVMSEGSVDLIHVVRLTGDELKGYGA